MSSRLRLCQFIIGLSLSRGVTRAVGVLFCRAFLSARPRLLGGPEIIPGRDGRRRPRAGVGIESRRCPGARLALPPSFPVWGIGPAAPRDLRRDRVAIHASGGRCSTRPCAHAIGPSSFSAVRRQGWLNCPGRRQLPRGRSAVWAETAAPAVSHGGRFG